MKSTPRDYARVYLELAHQARAAELSLLARRFWELVWKRRHFAWRQLIIAETEQLMYAQAGLTQVEVATAKPLQPAAAKKLESELKTALGQPVHLNFVVKPHLLAGIMVTTQDCRWDASLKGRLDQLYQALAGESG